MFEGGGALISTAAVVEVPTVMLSLPRLAVTLIVTSPVVSGYVYLNVGPVPPVPLDGVHLNS